ncbi:hypothetical protein HU200_053203 [Digitaria exilis]|uniref:non-specific serine/threonine protein kinase n=1 Tax=Digitaria exilis TaxID=1010633 RepID=A0A835E3H4_9POAL|nr:hypothetical protein HU200_053203 [Digitaria exilis]
MSVDISNLSVPQSNVLDPTPNILKCDNISTRVIQSFSDVHTTGSGESKWIYFYGFAAATFLVEVIFFSSAWLFVWRRELKPTHTLEGYKVLSSNFRRYSYKELEIATANFKEELGRGGSGAVYKGILDDGRAIAVKRLENVRQGKQEFQSELRIIGRINHMNLVRIWGFCSEGLHRMLVYELVENGSLATILFNSNILVGWKQRFNIAVGLAKGLAYLHHECLEWVIHCDVKPENILLDQNFEPKIIDFGLVRGTVGYMAPEWVSGLSITGKVDVYSYGVVLLELLSGTRVSDVAVGLDDELHMELRKLVRTLSERLEKEEHAWIAEFVDFRLNGELNHWQARMLIKLAVSCLEEDRNKRPTIRSYFHLLKLIVRWIKLGEMKHRFAYESTVYLFVLALAV